MPRGFGLYLVAALVALGLVGCRFEFEERDPWRAEAEEKCVAERLVQATDFMEAAPPLNGKGTCGMTKPFKVAAVNGGFVEFKPKATLSCPLIANVEAWFHETIQPAAMAWYGSPVVEIKQISAYSCRTMNGQPGASISEHAFGNALDIASFRFADGRVVDFKTGWKGKPEERGFLRGVHAAACERFSTVLAPGADMFHYDHIHVDLARRASGRTVCKPAPMTLPAPAPRYPSEVPVARAPSRAPAAQARNEPPDPFAISRGPERQPPMQASVAGPRVDSTSPWARPGAPVAPAAATGAAVIARESHAQPVGAPLVLGNHSLGNQSPPPHSFGAPVPIAQRVRDSLGLQPQGAPMQAPRTVPAQNPYGLVPPGRIPSARTGADATVTGSIAPAEKTETKKADAKKQRAKQPEPPASPVSSLMSPRSIAEEKPSGEAASVFNLLPAHRPAQ